MKITECRNEIVLSTTKHRVAIGVQVNKRIEHMEHIDHKHVMWLVYTFTNFQGISFHAGLIIKFFTENHFYMNLSNLYHIIGGLPTPTVVPTTCVEISVSTAHLAKTLSALRMFSRTANHA